MDYFRKYLGPSQGDLQPTGADTVSIINERMSSVINAWETSVYFHFNPIQIKYNNTGTLVSAFFFQHHDTVQSSNWVLSQLILEMDNKNLLPTLNTCLPSVQCATEGHLQSCSYSSWINNYNPTTSGLYINIFFNLSLRTTN